MSPNGQRVGGRGFGMAILVGQFTMPRGTAFATHWHPVHQLLCSERGLLRIRSEHGTWLLPPSLALWIPVEVPHATESEGDAVMRGAYVDPASCPHIDWRDPTVVEVTLFSERSSSTWTVRTWHRTPAHAPNWYSSTSCVRCR